MSDITKQSLSSLIKNIKEKKLSSVEITKAFIFKPKTRDIHKKRTRIICEINRIFCANATLL